jgi:hypothetical protein
MRYDIELTPEQIEEIVLEELKELKGYLANDSGGDDDKWSVNLTSALDIVIESYESP